MPSEMGGEKKNPLPSITHPQVSQSYRCIETFETKDMKNKTFKVTQEDIVEVLIKDLSGTCARGSFDSGRDGAG